MNLTLPKCPSCGADVTLSADKRSAHCAYCNKDILVVGASASAASPGTENLLVLAREAAKAEDNEEASRLWSRVLETDPVCVEAWLGKAKAVSMTLATMTSDYEGAESYCRKAIEVAGDKKDARKSVSSTLNEQLLRMAHVAEEHKDEFAEVDGAIEEYVQRMDLILDAYERLAELAESRVPYRFGMLACDMILRDRIVSQVKSVTDIIEARRQEFARKAGPLLASEAAPGGETEGPTDNAPATTARSASGQKGRTPGATPSVVSFPVVAVVIVLLAAAGGYVLHAQSEAARAHAASDEAAPSVDASPPVVERADSESPSASDFAGPPANATKTASGLAYRLLHSGAAPNGRKPGPASTVQVNYRGWTTDGKMFDNSATHERPAIFPLNRVIKGWTEGFQLMKIGDKTRFWVPAKLAYEDPGRPARPGAPRGMLVFDVELVDIKQAP